MFLKGLYKKTTVSAGINSQKALTKTGFPGSAFLMSARYFGDEVGVRGPSPLPNRPKSLKRKRESSAGRWMWGKLLPRETQELL